MERVKEQVRKILDHLPEDCSVEDVQEQLFFLERLRRRLEEADRGDFVTHDEAVQRLSKWLSK